MTLQTVAAIAIGGNLGEVATRISNAIELLSDDRRVRLLRQSRLYQTAPVGSNAGEAFLNGAVLIETTYEAVALLDCLQVLETALGRVRTLRWGPRTLDLDLIRFGDHVIQTDRLLVPHPACWYRRFVLDPWSEIDPDWTHPVLAESVSTMRERLLDRPMRLSFSDRLMNEFTETIQSAETAADLQIAITAPSDAVIHFAMSDEKSVTPRTIQLSTNQGINDQLRSVFQAISDEPSPL